MGHLQLDTEHGHSWASARSGPTRSPPIALQVSGRQLNCFRDNSQGSLLSVVPLCNAKCFATVPHGGHEKCFRVVLPDSTLAQSSYLFAADAQRSTFASPRHDHDVPVPLGGFRPGAAPLDGDDPAAGKNHSSAEPRHLLLRPRRRRAQGVGQRGEGLPAAGRLRAVRRQDGGHRAAARGAHPRRLRQACLQSARRARWRRLVRLLHGPSDGIIQRLSTPPCAHRYNFFMAKGWYRIANFITSLGQVRATRDGDAREWRLTTPHPLCSGRHRQERDGDWRLAMRVLCRRAACPRRILRPFRQQGDALSHEPALLQWKPARCSF